MTGSTRRPGEGGPGDRGRVEREVGERGGAEGGYRRAGSGDLDRDPQDKPRGMERLADLLPRTARQFGLEDQLEQARAAAAWLEIVAERVPAAAGSCRLVDLRQGVATVETDEPIVAQEVRLRSPELLAALRATTRAPVRQLRITTRHV
jgi:predicted nucleic acid-binding Zn ribbon protein